MCISVTLRVSSRVESSEEQTSPVQTSWGDSDGGELQWDELSQEHEWGRDESKRDQCSRVTLVSLPFHDLSGWFLIQLECLQHYKTILGLDTLLQFHLAGNQHVYYQTGVLPRNERCRPVMIGTTKPIRVARKREFSALCQPQCFIHVRGLYTHVMRDKKCFPLHESLCTFLLFYCALRKHHSK